MGCDCALKAVGAAALGLLALKVAHHLWSLLYPFLLGARKDLKKLAGANTAVVTGATDGIGRAYAFELAQQGFDLVLVSRTQAKLDETAQAIRQQSPHVKVDTVAFDFGTGDVNAYKEKLLPQLDRYEVGVLVNNVGMSYEYPERLDRLAGGLERVAAITLINTLPVTLLSAHLLKQMNERRRGVIINLSSSACAKPMAFWAIYSATKQYVSWLSTILRREYASRGITIQTVVPMMVATKMSKIRKTSLFVPEASKYTKSALATVGLADETTGYLYHQLQHDAVFRLLPDALVNHFVDANSLATRARALKKLAAQKEE